MWALALGIVALLAGAAFVGARLIRTGHAVPSLSGGRSVAVVFAPELPASEPDQAGLVVRIQDNSLIIRARAAQLGASPSGAMAASPDGPEVEIVVGHATMVYEDVTKTDLLDRDATEIRQVLEPATVDDLSVNDMIYAWGEKRGDRFFAAVLTYRPSGIKRAPVD